MPRPSPHNLPARSLCPPRPSRIPRLSSSKKESLDAPQAGSEGHGSSSSFDQITSAPRYYDVSAETSLAARLRAKLHAISPRRPPEASSLSSGNYQALIPIIEDSFSSEPIEISNAATAFLETDQDQDFHSQSATLVENESPRPQSVVLLPSRKELTAEAVTTVRTVAKTVERGKKEKKKALKHPFRVDKLRLFLNKTRIGWKSTIPMLQMSPRIVILDISIEDRKMAITFALQEDISTVKRQQQEGKSYGTMADTTGLTIEDKLKKAKDIALDEATDEEAKIVALEEVLNEMKTSGGQLDDWLLDEIEDISTIYGELLGIDEIDMQIESIIAENKARVPQLDDPEELWLFDEERVCVGLKGMVWCKDSSQ
ncbi:hypothetical protein TWF679_010457 [Orbilia oligospora]|uniref:Uncharacterized protein n=1 Tax=Orbilia oligospora TaxID=2813651 RepID=A0A8H8V0J3_ORBOL|nr:hypothetical protein TWF679_010457 [Orbilia oligospora]